MTMQSRKTNPERRMGDCLGDCRGRTASPKKTQVSLTKKSPAYLRGEARAQPSFDASSCRFRACAPLLRRRCAAVTAAAAAAAATAHTSRLAQWWGVARRLLEVGIFVTTAVKRSLRRGSRGGSAPVHCTPAQHRRTARRFPRSRHGFPAGDAATTTTTIPTIPTSFSSRSRLLELRLYRTLSLLALLPALLAPLLRDAPLLVVDRHQVLPVRRGAVRGQHRANGVHH